MTPGCAPRRPKPKAASSRWATSSKCDCRRASPITGEVIFKAVEGDYATQRDVSRRKRDIKTIGLKLKVDNPDGELVPGMTAEVLLPKDLTQSLARGGLIAGSVTNQVDARDPVRAPVTGDAILVDHITKKYGDFTAVDDVSFACSRVRSSACSVRMAQANPRSSV